MAVIRNIGMKGSAIGAIEGRLPAGLGGLQPCNPPAPEFGLRKTVDEATGIVTSTVVVWLSKDMMSKYGAGDWRLRVASAGDIDNLNQSNVPFGDYVDFTEYGLEQDYVDIDDAAMEAGYIEIGNDKIYFVASFDFTPAPENPLYDYKTIETEGLYPLTSVWALNPYGVSDDSGSINLGRPLVTYDPTGYYAHVVTPVGSVMVDGVDSHKAELWIPNDGKKHKVYSSVGWWGRNTYLTKDNIIRCGRMTFVSDSDTADVDFTTMAGVDHAVAVYAAKQAEQQMAQRIAAAVAAGKAVIDVNPSSTVEQLVSYTDVEFVDPGGLSTVDGGFAYDSSINGGCYRIRMFGKAQDEQYSTERIVGLTVGDVSGNFYASSATIESVTVGDVSGNFSADSATIESVTVGDVGGIFSASSATIETMTVGDCGEFYASYATIESVTVGDVSGNFSADSATIESVTVGDVSGNFSATSATIESVTVGDVSGNFSADSATIESVTVGDVGGDFYADYATIESVTVGDCGNFFASSATIESVTVGDCGIFFASSATIESVTLRVTQVISSGDVTDGHFSAIYVPSALVSDFKTSSIFADNYADIIYPISA